MTDDPDLGASPEQVTRWTQRLRAGAPIRTSRSAALFVLLVLFSGFVAFLMRDVVFMLWDWAHGRWDLTAARVAGHTAFAVAFVALALANIAVRLGLLLLVVSFWMRFWFEEIALRDNHLEYQDWRRRRRLVPYADIMALSRRWRRRHGRRRGRESLLRLRAVDGTQDWIKLPAFLWFEGLWEAFKQEVIWRCGLTEMLPSPAAESEDDIVWQRTDGGLAQPQ